MFSISNHQLCRIHGIQRIRLDRALVVEDLNPELWWSSVCRSRLSTAWLTRQSTLAAAPPLRCSLWRGNVPRQSLASGPCALKRERGCGSKRASAQTTPQPLDITTLKCLVAQSRSTSVSHCPLHESRTRPSRSWRPYNRPTVGPTPDDTDARRAAMAGLRRLGHFSIANRA